MDPSSNQWYSGKKCRKPSTKFFIKWNSFVIALQNQLNVSTFKDEKRHDTLATVYTRLSSLFQSNKYKLIIFFDVIYQMQFIFLH